MEWLAENWLWIVAGGLFIGMHLFGHGCHGGHSGHSGGKGAGGGHCGDGDAKEKGAAQPQLPEARENRAHGHH